MDDLDLLVGVPKGHAGLAHPVGDIVDLENAVLLFNPQGGQGLAVDILHRDGGGLRVAHEIIDANDVGMCQLEAAPRLALEVIEGAGVEMNGFRKKLERHFAVQPFIVRKPDDPHPAAAQHMFQGVAPKDLLADDQAANGYAEVEIIGDGRKLGCHNIRSFRVGAKSFGLGWRSGLYGRQAG